MTEICKILARVKRNAPPEAHLDIKELEDYINKLEVITVHSPTTLFSQSMARTVITAMKRQRKNNE